MSDPNESRLRAAPRRSLKTTALALAVLIGVALWIWLQGSEQRAIGNLPEAERVALYERTLANVQSVCVSPDLALDEYCRDQARILLEFPECDADCREQARVQAGRRNP